MSGGTYATLIRLDNYRMEGKEIDSILMFVSFVINHEPINLGQLTKC